MSGTRTKVNGKSVEKIIESLKVLQEQVCECVVSKHTIKVELAAEG